MIERKDKEIISEPKNNVTSDDMIVRILLMQKELSDMQKDMLEITKKLAKKYNNSVWRHKTNE